MSEKTPSELPFLVDRARKYSEKEKEDTLRSFGLPRIAIVGVGGAGNNTINRVEAMGGIEGVMTIAINTDRLHLDAIRADKNVLIGESLTGGLSASGDIEMGREAAKHSRDILRDILKDQNLVFIIAGMGGGTGTGASPIVAEIAKEAGAIVVAMVFFPFGAERRRRIKAADGIEELRRVTDTLVVLENDKLLKYLGELIVNDAFKVMDQLIAETVRGISKIITLPSWVNLDFADLKAVLGAGDFAMLLVGETAKEENKPLAVVHDALSHPLIEADCKGAKGALIHISGGNDLTMKETNDIVELLTYDINPDANVIWGATISKEYNEGNISAMAIMTGVHWKTPANLTKDNREQKTLKGLIKV